MFGGFGKIHSRVRDSKGRTNRVLRKFAVSLTGVGRVSGSGLVSRDSKQSLVTARGAVPGRSTKVSASFSLRGMNDPAAELKLRRALVASGRVTVITVNPSNPSHKENLATRISQGGSHKEDLTTRNSQIPQMPQGPQGIRTLE